MIWVTFLIAIAALFGGLFLGWNQGFKDAKSIWEPDAQFWERQSEEYREITVDTLRSLAKAHERNADLSRTHAEQLEKFRAELDEMGRACGFMLPPKP